ncbi:LON peptidase substrate-binding domain-containing protein [Kordiimonas aquimaris]|uniref:LON peptidase substrate-binding domain-containing protein n=1 Tax=Kordiimonas aquimaris TaxID=707591 RepID=UPI0021CE7193|nr:LON peptidase substrate-binding domain-containing protein [Kordiimonas aquimaris]
MVEKKSETITLPPVIPVFPLNGVILIPGSNLPLNIFEPRYLQMVRDAATSNNLIGMIQPKSDDPTPDLYDVGAVGKIEDFTEVDENRFSIRLRGLARFSVIEELSATTPYRQVAADWHLFSDMNAAPEEAILPRRELLATLSDYLDFRGLDADFEAIAEAPDDVLVNTLSMVVPFDAPEKQALLEARSIAGRAQTLQTLLAMALIDVTSDTPTNLH